MTLPEGLDLAVDTIFVALAGSQAHGTAGVGSDVDLRGVCIAPLAVRASLFGTFEQHEGPLEGALWAAILPRLEIHPTASRGLGVRTECVVYDVAKFLRLAAAANPNALEILFADEQDWVHETPAWRRLHAERHIFLSKQVQETYLGYAMAQLKKIKSHRAWLLAPPAARPTRAQFGLSEQGTLNRDDRNKIEEILADKIRSYGIDDLELPKAARIALEERLRTLLTDALGVEEAELGEELRAIAVGALRLAPGVVAALRAERRYRSALKHWESFETWKAERNPTRAALEARHGYDTKHAMHLLRLMITGLEILRTGDLLVRRPDAEYLKAVRDGALGYEPLLETAAALQAEMVEAARETPLPARADRRRIEALALELIRAR